MLPAELWIRIFREATQVQQLLDIPPYDYFTTEPVLTSKEKQMLLKESYKTKLSIVKVCKMWYTLGKEVLYEAILITTPKALRSLADSFEMQCTTPLIPDGVRPGLRTAGIYTKRIDFASYLDLSHIDNVAARIPRYTPNLQTFVELGRHHSTFRKPHHCTPPSFVYEMSVHCAGSLRVLEWESSYAIPPFFAIDGLLRRCHDLRSLLLHGSSVNGQDVPSHLPDLRGLKSVVSLGSYTCLRFSERDLKNLVPNELAGLEPPLLPNLVHLNESSHSFASYPEEHIERKRILRMLGENITTIETHFPKIVPTSRLQEVLDACPRASTLILDIQQALASYDLPTLLGHEFRVAHHSIRRIGLRSNAKQYPTSIYIRLSYYCEMTSRFPNLDVIKILSEHISHMLQSLHMNLLWRWATDLEEQGVALLLWDNEPFIRGHDSEENPRDPFSFYPVKLAYGNYKRSF